MAKPAGEEPPGSCLPCRLISGSVLIGCGFYIGYHASKLKKGKNVALLVATGSGVIGVLRIFNLLPHMG